MKAIKELVLYFIVVVSFITLFIYGIDRQMASDQIYKGQQPTDCIFSSNCNLKSFNVSKKQLKEYELNHKREQLKYNNEQEVINQNGSKYLVSYDYYLNENNDIVKVKEDKELLDDDFEYQINTKEIIDYLAD